MTDSPGGAVSAYWRSVTDAANGPEGPKRSRAVELLRLKEVADQFRATYLPELPAITIATADIGGRVSGKVDPLGSWGQGVSIHLKTSRVDPFNTKDADAGRPPELGDRSLIFGHPIKLTRAGEQLRQIEAELLVLQQLLRSFQHLTVERSLMGFGAAKSDLKSYGGNGSWYAGQANHVWRQWCAAEGFPFVPVRHSRQGYELEHPSFTEANPEDERFGWLRPSCSGWPMSAMAQARDPRVAGDAPESITVGEDSIPVPPELWARWCREEVVQSSAIFARVQRGEEGMLFEALAWPEGALPQIDEVDSEPVVRMPVISKPIATNAKITINYNAAEALQAMEALLTSVDRDRGSSLWPEFLGLACNHPKAPGATRVQQELAVKLEPTPIDPGQVDLAAAIAAQCGCDHERATAVVERIKRFLLSPDPLTASYEAMGSADRHAMDTLAAHWGKGKCKPAPIDPGDSSTHRLAIGFAWPHSGTNGLRDRFVVGIKEGKTITQLICQPNPKQGSAFTDRPAPWPVIYERAEADAAAKRHGCSVFRADTAEQLLSTAPGWQWADEQAPIDPGESGPAGPEPEPTSLRARVEAIEAASSQSQLRKLPEWPADSSKSRATGQRKRLTDEQAAVLTAEIQSRIDAGLKQTEIAEELVPWCGQSASAITNRARKLQKQEAA